MINIDLIDSIELYARRFSMIFSRINEYELIVQLQSDNNECNVHIIFNPECDCICFSSNLDWKVSKNKYKSIMEGIARMNEKMCIGHFDILFEENIVVYRLSIPFVFYFVPDDDMVEDIFSMIISECNRFYEYFSYLSNLKISSSSSEANTAQSGVFVESIGEA